ncbi:Short-chain alcohol dehydrogenase family protein [Cystobacter fuscus DSM 2262]|uniref:Short-chain alcohol dehydrogenase family protein n=1 Tax=Cystobacter fuscus (strain ATCC 25194 / DSM 2262 / NBRC 100088 / M29) TaxID=1242864 RepID=S9P621_CYSF2|nr:SDR family oxidoreductase [Cystobacter fuscus]EPX59930.1 Short-chain alcohol dehydrogenase family protein [Cystobacter fuscus DSM 2262]
MSDALVIVITGATHGIGRAAAIELARRGAHLGLVARSETKAAQTRADIQREAPGAVVDVFLADLSVLDDVRRVARQLDEHYDRIDVLVNNAGLHAFSQRVTGDGLPEMVAVNYVAPWLLTDLLRDKLIASAPCRIVNVASDAHRQVRTLEPERDLRSTGAFSMAESFELYARSKLMDILFTQELALRLAGTGVTANSCCPGLNASGLGRESKLFNGLAGLLTRWGLLSPERGARIIVRLATDPEFKEVTGGFFSSTRRFRSLPPASLCRDAELQRRLWRATAELVARN